MIRQIMVDNICIECGKIIEPGEYYYINDRNNIYCNECVNNEIIMQ